MKNNLKILNVNIIKNVLSHIIKLNNIILQFKNKIHILL